MATLYTPEARTQGLDWLAGMVQNSQSLWQRERQLQQEAQRLQQAKQLAQEQTKQFWAQQARLAEQDEFQKRKFLYGVADDTRKFEWDQTRAKMDFGLRERSADLQAQQEARLAEGQKWDMSPQNPDYQWRAAQVVKANVDAAQGIQELEENSQPSQFDLPTGEGGATSDALFRPSGDPYAPGTIITPSGQKMDIVATSIDKKGRPTSFSLRAVPTNDDWSKALRDEIDTLQDNYTATMRSKKQLPRYPTAPAGAELTAGQIDAYKKQVAEVENNNRLVQRQADSIARDLRVREAQNRMMDLNIKDFPITEAFSNVAPLFGDALQRRDPTALENLRVQIKPLADKGDPSAKQAMNILDNVLGKEEEGGDDKLRTGADHWKNLKP